MKKKEERLIKALNSLADEFTIQEIRQALNSIEKEEQSSSIVKDSTPVKESPSIKGITSKRKSKSISEQRSKAVLDLRNVDIKKYELLSEFDLLVRKGEILENPTDIRKLGIELSKDFPNSKSRKQLVSQLMKLLAQKSIDEIQELLSNLVSSSKIKESEYQRLAKFIISGS